MHCQCPEVVNGLAKFLDGPRMPSTTRGAANVHLIAPAKTCLLPPSIGEMRSVSSRRQVLLIGIRPPSWHIACCTGGWGVVPNGWVAGQSPTRTSTSDHHSELDDNDLRALEHLGGLASLIEEEEQPAEQACKVPMTACVPAVHLLYTTIYHRASCTPSTLPSALCCLTLPTPLQRSPARAHCLSPPSRHSLHASLPPHHPSCSPTSPPDLHSQTLSCCCSPLPAPPAPQLPCTRLTALSSSLSTVMYCTGGLPHRGAHIRRCANDGETHSHTTQSAAATRRPE